MWWNTHITVGTNLDLFLRSNFSKQMIPNFHVLPQFYKDMLLNWIEFTNDKNNISSSHRYAHLIWYNTFIYGHNSPMEYFNNRLFQAGLWFVSDLFYDNDKLIPFNIWMKRGVLAQDYLTWRGLVTTVRQKSMKYIRNNSDEKLQDKPLVNSSKEIIISMKPKLFENIKGKQIKYVFTERALHQVKYKNKIYYYYIITHYMVKLSVVTGKMSSKCHTLCLLITILEIYSIRFCSELRRQINFYTKWE